MLVTGKGNLLHRVSDEAKMTRAKKKAAATMMLLIMHQSTADTDRVAALWSVVRWQLQMKISQALGSTLQTP